LKLFFKTEYLNMNLRLESYVNIKILIWLFFVICFRR